MMHPSREKYIPYFVEMLGEDVKIAMDTDNNVWHTCRKAWMMHDMNCEYGVVIQDDAILTERFIEKAEEFLKDSPDGIVSFYAGNLMRPQFARAKSRGKDRVSDPMIYNEVALCMRTEDIEDMVSFCDEKEATTDHEIAKWAKKNKKPIIYSVPCLVDHRDEESIYRKNYNQPDFLAPRKALDFEK